jgi:hypothetical protein
VIGSVLGTVGIVSWLSEQSTDTESSGDVQREIIHTKHGIILCELVHIL